MTPSMELDLRQDNQPDADRFSVQNRRCLSGPGLRTFVRIADLWGLNQGQRRLVLGKPPRSTYRTWLKAAREQRDLTLTVDVLMRISATLGIHQALGVLHAEERDGVAWLRGTNRAAPFGGMTPLDVMLDGTLEGLLAVRRFLDAMIGGWRMEPNENDSGFRPYTNADIVMS